MLRKHTDAPNASQGLKAYMALLLGSKLPPVQAKGKRLQAMSRKARLDAYLAEFGEHFVQDESTNDSPKGGEMANLSKLTKAQLIELLEGNVEADESEEVAEGGFVKGCTFSYTASATGKARKHKIVRVGKHKGRNAVWTNTDKRFYVDTLESLTGSVVEIV